MEKRATSSTQAKACAAIILLAYCRCASALNPSLDLRQYTHTAWPFREGLLNGTVSAFAQTPDGYLWLGTQSGVVRFDGVRAAPLALLPGQQLPSTPVSALLAGRDGTLCIGTLDGRASWKNGRLTRYQALAQYSVNALLQDWDGTICERRPQPPQGLLEPPGTRNFERIQPGQVILMYPGSQPEEQKGNPG